MDSLIALAQGTTFNKNKEGFVSLDAALSTYADGHNINVDGEDFTTVKDNALNKYRTFFCLNSNDTMVKKGENYVPINGGSMIQCAKPNIDINKLDRLLKTTDNKYYYVNNYGYIKKVADIASELHPSCNSKSQINTNVDEGIGLSPDQTFNSLINKSTFDAYKSTLNEELKKCNSGNYNLMFCNSPAKSSCTSDSTDNCTQCQYAYLSPKGELKVYSNWDTRAGSGEPYTYSGAKKSTCGKLPLVEVKGTDVAFDRPNFPPDVSQSDFNDIDSTIRATKASAISHCFAYKNEASPFPSEYGVRLENKITSDLKIDEMSDQFQININNYNTLKTDINNASSSAIDLTTHEKAQKYEKSLIELKKKLREFDTEDRFEDYVNKMNSSKFQQLLWLGSAISLVIIAIGQIRKI